MLSKSRILSVWQCRRRLWLEARRPDLRTHSTEVRRRLDQGRQLDALVHRLYPDGALIDEELSLPEALRETARHLVRSPRHPLFEATFSQQGVVVRADIFRSGENGYQLTEVKSSTRVKPYHLLDCAIQNWVISAAGYPIEQTFLAHIDTRFLYRGDSDYSGLLRRVDVSERIAELIPKVPGLITACLETLSRPEEPDIPTGPHCTRPFSCPLKGHCSPTTTEYPIRLLPGGGHIIKELAEQGIQDIRDIPDGRLQKPLHRRVRQATIRGRAYIGQEIRQALLELPYPRYYLDFESIQFTIPRWARTRPYQQLPFQWSCHIENAPGELRHSEFLERSGEPPMRLCAEALIDTLGNEGPIFCYSRYERTVIHQLAARFTDLAPGLNALAERLFDLLPLIKAHYYHPAMKGSYSVKAVLPTVAPELSYDGLTDVHDGVGAQLAYEQLIDADTPARRKSELSDQLREYCRLDTLAMVRMVQFFEAGSTAIRRP